MYGRNKTLITSIFLLIFAGLFGLTSLYISRLMVQLFVLGGYMIIGLFLLFIWVKNQSIREDFDNMTKVTNYFSFVGTMELLLLYLFVN